MRSNSWITRKHETLTCGEYVQPNWGQAILVVVEFAISERDEHQVTGVDRQTAIQIEPLET